ncbi:MAG: riboflavin synthase [Bdellovibrionales bacterium]|nr:riboflavin synthase [Bdellovibrionales bacterium]
MFTGIVTAVAPLLRVEALSQGSRLILRNPYGKLDLGESIALNGACMTVEGFSEGAAGEMSFFVSPESLRRTNLGFLTAGQKVNLERALPASGRLSGHIVQGHVDGLAKLVECRPEGQAWRLEFDLPQDLARYCVEKGSICLDGVSLTINQILPPGNRLWIQVIPHTWENTHFHERRVGDRLNLEVDILAKYVEGLCRPHLSQ